MNWFKYALISLLKYLGFDLFKENKELYEKVSQLQKEVTDLKAKLEKCQANVLRLQEEHSDDKTKPTNLPRYYDTS